MFARDKLIRFHHCDPAGIVFYPQYFVLFNELIEDWFNEGLMINFAEFHETQKLGFPMRRLECDFLAPSKLGDKLTLELEVKNIGNSSVTVAVSGSSGGTERVRATLVVVLASITTHRPVPLPADLRTRLEKFQG